MSDLDDAIERLNPDASPQYLYRGPSNDALLAPGGPARLADATPKEGWRRAVEYLGSFLGVVRDAEMDAALAANPYDGFTRKEQNGGE